MGKRWINRECRNRRGDVLTQLGYPLCLTTIDVRATLCRKQVEGEQQMEFRVLQYFLAVTREQSISGAAEALHLSQPTLSRQMKELEDELGKPLFIRGSRRVTLTEEGMLLRERAEQITELVKKTEDEIALSDSQVAGNIAVGAGETVGVRFLIQAAQKLRCCHPQVYFTMMSGDKITVLENLERGLIDFGLVHGDFDRAKYDSLPAPHVDRWGVLMPVGAKLAQKESVAPEDLWDKPLIISRHMCHDGSLSSMLGRELSQLNVVACYNLLFNGAMMAGECMGYTLCLDHIANTVGNNSICFRPLSPTVEAPMQLLWKKYQTLTKPAKEFLEILRNPKD